MTNTKRVINIQNKMKEKDYKKAIQELYDEFEEIRESTRKELDTKAHSKFADFSVKFHRLTLK